MKHTKQKNNNGSEYDYKTHRYYDKLSEYYSPCSIITIVLLLCLVLVTFGRIIRSLDVCTGKLECQPIANISQKIFQHDDTTLQNNNDNRCQNQNVWLALPIKFDNGNIYCENNKRRKPYVFHYDTSAKF